MTYCDSIEVCFGLVPEWCNFCTLCYVDEEIMILVEFETVHQGVRSN